MASCKLEEQEGETKSLALACEHLSVCSLHDPLEDYQPDPHTPPTKTQTPGKLRRTALRFFGARKSICLLPAIFGGRSKSQTKKRVAKSQTHDGLSKAGGRDSPGSEGASGGRAVALGQRDGAQRSAHGDYGGFPAAEQKSQSFPRQKKGLRGLFNSIRLHRTPRSAEVESNEMAMLASSPPLQEAPAAAEEDAGQRPGGPSSPEVPEAFSDVAPECSDQETTAALEDGVAGPPGSPSVPDGTPDDLGDRDASAVEASRELLDRPAAPGEARLQPRAAPGGEGEEEEEPAGVQPTGSSDRLDLILEDVASLKSFDSLTGCGDIIADQDDDSLAESGVSGERSRSAGKRASCCLTYQGGGEEMASPDDLEADGLRHLWGETPEEDAFCSGGTEPTSDPGSSLCCARRSSATDASTLTPDALTPQSERQESVPNSDEGYYDSSTSGPQDPQEKLDRMGQTDRIPRDSYSGDALYELFVPEESLISPHYENGSGLVGSESCGYGLGSEGMADSAFLPDMNPLEMGSNLYEDQDFPSVFDAVMCNKSKEFSPFSQGCSGVRPPENANLNLKAQEFFNNNNSITLDVSHDNGNTLEPTERKVQPVNTDSFGGVADPDFTRFSPTVSETKDDVEENKPLPPLYGSSAGLRHGDEAQTVCFSQALVDYTKHSQLLRDNMDGLDSSSSSLSPNMEALPTIVTFDVMDMHNEGQYDDQLQEGLEDGAAPYARFQERYLQKECDYRLLNSIYEQNLFGNAWAVSSLPRRLGLVRGGPSATGPPSSDRRSRSLDREGLQRSACRAPGNAGGGGRAFPRAGEEPGRAYPVLGQEDARLSAFEVAEGGGFESLPWPVGAGGRGAPGDDRSRAALKNSFLVDSGSSHPPPAGAPRGAELRGRLCAPRLQPGESGPPYGSLAFPDMLGADLMTAVSASGEEGDVFYAPAFSVQTFGQFGQE